MELKKQALRSVKPGEQVYLAQSGQTLWTAPNGQRYWQLPLLCTFHKNVEVPLRNLSDTHSKHQATLQDLIKSKVLPQRDADADAGVDKVLWGWQWSKVEQVDPVKIVKYNGERCWISIQSSALTTVQEVLDAGHDSSANGNEDAAGSNQSPSKRRRIAATTSSNDAPASEVELMLRQLQEKCLSDVQCNQRTSDACQKHLAKVTATHAMFGFSSSETAKVASFKDLKLLVGSKGIKDLRTIARGQRITCTKKRDVISNLLRLYRDQFVLPLLRPDDLRRLLAEEPCPAQEGLEHGEANDPDLEEQEHGDVSEGANKPDNVFSFSNRLFKRLLSSCIEVEDDPAPGATRVNFEHAALVELKRATEVHVRCCLKDAPVVCTKIRTKTQVKAVDIQAAESRTEGGDLDDLWRQYERRDLDELPMPFMALSKRRFRLHLFAQRVGVSLRWTQEVEWCLRCLTYRFMTDVVARSIDTVRRGGRAK
eukprot:12431442-Karenia_brevis.AAC.1